MAKYKVFIICPMNSATKKQKTQIENYAKQLQSSDIEVCYPASNQIDNTGFKTCCDNRTAIADCTEVHVFWNKNSDGILFDLGVAFGLGKKLKIINPGDLDKKAGISFSNMIAKWSNE